MAYKRPSIDDYMTVPQVIKKIKRSKYTVYFWLRTGVLPHDSIGDTKLVLKTDVKKIPKQS